MILLKKFSNSPVQIKKLFNYHSYKMTPKQRQPDIKKAKELLGWEPNVGIADVLKITYDYFKSL